MHTRANLSDNLCHCVYNVYNKAEKVLKNL